MGEKRTTRIPFLVTILLSLLLSWIPLSFAEDGKVEFVPSADTYVDAHFSPLTNYGNLERLSLANSGNKMQVVWLKFNLSEHIPEGAVVDNATLKAFPTTLTETFEVAAFHCSNNSWGEYTINFRNQPTYNSTPLDTIHIPRSNEWYNWDVTQPVKDAFAEMSGGSKELSIVLKQVEPQKLFPSLVIGSREGTWSVQLYVHWIDIIPEFPSWTILPLLLATTALIVICRKRLTKHRRILGA
jgi:hypothetical protein